MRDSWLEIIDAALRPARSRLELCLREGELHLAAQRRLAKERARALAACAASIEGERAAVFAAGDGVVTWRMREFEREWLLLSRLDPDRGLMDLWARIAPASWIDRKLWRDSEPSERLDATLALAADVDGVLAAQTAVASLRAALAPWGALVGTRIRWRSLGVDSACMTAVLAGPLRVAGEGLSASTLERARGLEHDVHEAALVRLGDRPLLAGELAHAAFVDFIWRASSLRDRANPVTPLRNLWMTGYVPSSVDASGVTLELPPLRATLPS